MAEENGVAVPHVENEESIWMTIVKYLNKMFIMWTVFNLFRTFIGGGSISSQGNSTSTPAALGGGTKASNMFAPGELYDFHMFLYERDDMEQALLNGTLLWKEESLGYGDWTAGPNKDGSLCFETTMPTPDSLHRNESIFLHIFVTRIGKAKDIFAPYALPSAKAELVHNSIQLNLFKKKTYRKTSNLLTGETQMSSDDQAKAEVTKFEILNHWHPNITVNLIDDHTAWAKGMVPSPMDRVLKFDESGTFYQPILFCNNYWNLLQDYQPVNETVKVLNISVTFSPMSLFKYQLYLSQTLRNQWTEAFNVQGQQDDDNQDTIKMMFLDTHPALLAVTVLVSILHAVFEFLAFKNDIRFWKTRKSLEGISVLSVLFNIFQSFIIFLYICDNDANFVVKASVFVGLLIEMWKIPKVMNVTVVYENKILGIFPRIVISDKGEYVESETKAYDDMAFKYLSWVVFPLLIAYAVYSVVYDEHRGWYSWILSMLYGFLLTFGFITMTPQLFINYKLKSVAHLPWRMLTYKFINTFIDDLFAFVIRMPTLYRLGCFRDDIIFFVYLYQRWAYRVDPLRVNEFGVATSDPNAGELKDGTKTLDDSDQHVEKGEEEKKND